ncbi:MAG TPA: hypothetical protein VGQ57_06580, partial [Polyangiaceae bacterium]|nr:hypothetical protein [Polyangiaceae bacterium]
PSPPRTPGSVPPPAFLGPPKPQVSRPGRLLGRLQQLAESDPAKFKQVTADIADKLRQTAQGLSGAAADRANQLADRFAAASDSGEMASLRPPRGEGVHHHHHHGAGGGELASVLSSALDEVNQALSDAAPQGTPGTLPQS